MHENSRSLEENKMDYLSVFLKGGLGAVPIAGGLLAEIAGIFIPNQRMDRVVKFAQELEKRIAKMESESIKAKVHDENFVDLVEESIKQACQSLSDERRTYLAAIVEAGLSEEKAELIATRHILKILGELNDIEILWLRSYLVPIIGGDEEFRKRHVDTFKYERAHLNSPQEVRDKDTLQKSYKEHLVRVGLLEHRMKINSKTKEPEFNNKGNLTVEGYGITPLGKIMLKKIGLVNETVAKWL